MLTMEYKLDKEGSENVREVRDRIVSPSGVKRFLKLGVCLNDRK